MKIALKHKKMILFDFHFKENHFNLSNKSHLTEKLFEKLNLYISFVFGIIKRRSEGN